MTVSDADFERIMEGLADVDAFVRGDDGPGARVYIPAEIDIKLIRGKLKMTQTEFAERHGFSIGAVRDWEQGRRVPDQSTRAFLKVIAAAPEVVAQALKSA